jgi:hypothetical protein
LSGVLTRGLPGPSRTPRSLTAGAFACALLLVASFGTALVVGRPWQLTRLDTTVERRVDDVRISVPAALGPGRRQEPTAEGQRSLVFGDLLDSPFAVVVTIDDHDFDLADPALLEREFASFLQQPTVDPDGNPTVGERLVDMRGDMPAFRQRHRLPNGLETLVWYQLRPQHRVAADRLEDDELAVHRLREAIDVFIGAEQRGAQG